ncbi:unnamed protein product [Caenorhabditis brenneri]
MSRLVCPSAKPSSSVLLLFPSISRQFAIFLVLLLAVMEASGVSGIGCFVCSSFDGENKGCEDPFNSTMDLSSRDRDASAVANYNYPCWAYKKGRHGLFPADHCIKIVGYRADNDSKTLVIRTCALDSGTLTADTEIVRISHCGSFKYEGHQYKGCVQSCDTDGSASSSNTKSTMDERFGCLFLSLLLVMFFILLLVLLFRESRTAVVEFIKRRFEPKQESENEETVQKQVTPPEVLPPKAPPRTNSVRIPITIRRESAQKLEESVGKSIELPPRKSVQLEEIPEVMVHKDSKTKDESAKLETPIMKSNDYIYV